MKRDCIKRAVAFLMAAGVFSSSVFAGEPAVATDEAAYVNLDYYGGVSDISIVKSAAMNGRREIVDYGAYETVTNMTDYTVPELSEDSVKFQLQEDVDYFYYECVPKDGGLVLPWTFDVSYKLNGVQKTAEELAGASGLVEINITATANPEAKEYYRNNLLLQVAAMVNMEDVYSVEAPGSQLQAMGAYKAVVFAALPGESKTFTIRIGTDSFEFQGLTMLMIPGTLDQVKDIKDLKESKDKVKDAADDIYDGLDSLFGAIQEMSDGLKETQNGLADLEDARAGISSAKGTLHDYAGEALGKLASLAQDINSLTPNLQDGQQFVKEINQDVNDMVSTIQETKGQLTRLKSSLDSMKYDLADIQNALADADALKKDRAALFENLEKSLTDFGSSTEGLKNNTKSLGESMGDLQDSTRGLRGISGDLIQIGNILGSADPELGEAIGAVSGQIGSINSKTGSLLADIGDFAATFGATSTSLKGMTESGEHLANTLAELTQLMDAYIVLLEDNYTSEDDLLTQSQNIIDTLTEAADTAAALIDETVAINDTLNQYEPTLSDLLQKSETLTGSMTDSMVATLTFLNAIEREIRINGEKLDSGTQKTIAGLSEVLDKGISGIADTDILKQANSSVKETVDKELARFEEDTNVLNMDSEQPMESFTSDKNPEPESIQIILRTEEISVKDEEAVDVDLEAQGEKTGMWERIKQVFLSIWQAIASFFQKD